MQKKIFLFDFDGTLADSLPAIVAIYNELSATYRLPRKITTDEIPYLQTLSLPQFIKEFHIPPLKIPFLLYSGKKLFSKYISSITPVPGIKEALSELKKNDSQLGIVTSNTKKNVLSFLKKDDLELFDFIHSEKGLFGKDKVLKHVIKTYTLPKDHTYYIGDEIRDIDAARKAGIKIISVTWGANTKEALEKAQPDSIIEQPSELLQFAKQ